MKLWDEKTPMALIIAAIVIVVAVISYKSSHSTQNQVTIPSPPAVTNLTSASPNSSPVVDITGTYQGKLPCADCPAILEEMTLNADGTYSLKDTYQGKSTAPYSETGKWTTLGTAADSNATIVQLTPNAQGQKKNFQFSENTLNPLDQNMKPLQTPFNQTLTKK